MKVIIFGATGMVGQGVLAECLKDGEITEILTVGRSISGIRNPRVKELEHRDLMDLSGIEAELTGYDACFFCLGVSSVGMSEHEYERITYQLTLAVAKELARLNPGMVFEYVSGSGTDSTEKGGVRWARVKGRTENDLLKLPFRGAYMFRPAMIQPGPGIKSKTPLYQVVYSITRPLLPVLKGLLPAHVTTSEKLGQAMIHVARFGFSKPWIENREINEMQV